MRVARRSESDRGETRGEDVGPHVCKWKWMWRMEERKKEIVGEGKGFCVLRGSTDRADCWTMWSKCFPQTSTMCDYVCIEPDTIESMIS